MLKHVWIVPLAVAGLMAACVDQNSPGPKGSPSLSVGAISGTGRSLAHESDTSPPPSNPAGDREVTANPEDQPGSFFNGEGRNHTFKDIIIPKPFSEQDPLLL